MKNESNQKNEKIIEIQISKIIQNINELEKEKNKVINIQQQIVNNKNVTLQENIGNSPISVSSLPENFKNLIFSPETLSLTNEINVNDLLNSPQPNMYQIPINYQNFNQQFTQSIPQTNPQQYLKQFSNTKPVSPINPNDNSFFNQQFTQSIPQTNPQQIIVQNTQQLENFQENNLTQINTINFEKSLKHDFLVKERDEIFEKWLQNEKLIIEKNDRIQKLFDENYQLKEQYNFDEERIANDCLGEQITILEYQLEQAIQMKEEKQTKLSEANKENKKLLEEIQQLKKQNETDKQIVTIEKNEKYDKDKEIKRLKNEKYDKDKEIKRLKNEKYDKDKEIKRLKNEKYDKDKEIKRLKLSKNQKNQYPTEEKNERERVTNALRFEKYKSKINNETSTSKSQSFSSKSQKI